MVTTNQTLRESAEPIAVIFHQISLQNYPDRYAIVLYKNLYEIQSRGGPLYNSILDVSEEDKQGLDVELLDRAIQIMNAEEDVDTIVELYETYFPETNGQNGGKRKSRNSKTRKHKSKKRSRKTKAYRRRLVYV
jgi:hypothetical protein